MPVTAGYGPRFLHSTGQLHKGGPNIGRRGADRAALAARRRSASPASRTTSARSSTRKRSVTTRASCSTADACCASPPTTSPRSTSRDGDAHAIGDGWARTHGRRHVTAPHEGGPRGRRVRRRPEGASPTSRPTAPSTPRSPEDMVEQLDAPRVVWLMLPAGTHHARQHRSHQRRCCRRATSSSTAATRVSPTASAAPRRCKRARSRSSTPA